MKLELRGVQEELQRLRGITKRLRDLTPALNAGAQDMKTLVVDTFRKGVSPVDGMAWKPLAESTIEKRRENRSGSTAGYKPLVDTGTLRSSIGTGIGIDRKSIFMSTNVPYAKFHQLGSSKVKNRPPARPFLPTEDGAVFAYRSGSPAEKTYLRVVSRVRNYIMTGKATADAKGGK